MRFPPLLGDFSHYQHTTVVCCGGGLNKYHRPGADALQLTLVPRFSFRARLTAGVGLLISSLHHSVLSLQEVWRVYSRGNAMTLEEVVVAKLQQLPENERQQLLVLIDAWIEQHRAADTRDIQRALAAVQSTWATVTLDQKTLRWVAEDKELEYELG
jgi:hypothetical protein